MSANGFYRDKPPLCTQGLVIGYAAMTRATAPLYARRARAIPHENATPRERSEGGQGTALACARRLPTGRAVLIVLLPTSLAPILPITPITCQVERGGAHQPCRCIHAYIHTTDTTPHSKPTHICTERAGVFMVVYAHACHWHGTVVALRFSYG